MDRGWKLQCQGKQNEQFFLPFPLFFSPSDPCLLIHEGFVVTFHTYAWRWKMTQNASWRGEKRPRTTLLCKPMHLLHNSLAEETRLQCYQDTIINTNLHILTCVLSGWWWHSGNSLQPCVTLGRIVCLQRLLSIHWKKPLRYKTRHVAPKNAPFSCPKTTVNHGPSAFLCISICMDAAYLHAVCDCIHSHSRQEPFQCLHRMPPSAPDGAFK